jgi:hypothetical protein
MQKYTLDKYISIYYHFEFCRYWICKDYQKIAPSVQVYSASNIQIQNNIRKLKINMNVKLITPVHQVEFHPKFSYLTILFFRFYGGQWNVSFICPLREIIQRSIYKVNNTISISFLIHYLIIVILETVM